MHAYERVASELAQEIKDGRWPAGTALPTIPELMERFDVSRITVRGGLDDLMAQGLVYTGWADNRRGTIVRGIGRAEHYATDALRADRPASPNDAFVENARRIGREPGKKFTMNMAVAPEEIAERLGVAADALVVIRTTVQLLDGEPWARERSYYERGLAELVGLDVPRDIPEGTIRALAAAGHKEIAYTDEVTDESAGPSEVDDLGVPLGAPLLVQTRTAASTDRITRVTQFHRLGRRVRLCWELGDDTGLEIIRAARPSAPAS